MISLLAIAASGDLNLQTHAPTLYVSEDPDPDGHWTIKRGEAQ